MKVNLKHARLEVYWYFLKPFSERSRKERMRSFLTVMRMREGMSVLDLGGQPMIWDNVPISLDITILNRPGIAATEHPSHHRIRYVDGDACQVHGFEEKSFDTVFSNSVIEHVGPSNKQEDFAREVRRLGKSYWVQTPSKWFPLEPHSGMPFWWFYPDVARRYFIRRWRRKVSVWTQMVEETTVLTKEDLQRLFPEATIFVETYLGFPKSYVAYLPPSG